MKSASSMLLLGAIVFSSHEVAARQYEYRIITKKTAPTPLPPQSKAPPPQHSGIGHAESSEPQAPSPQNTPSVSDNVPQDVNESPASLHIMCVGAGTAIKPDVATSYGSFNGSVMSSNGGWGSFSGSGDATTYGTRAQDFNDQVSLELAGSEGRLRMPRTMLPVIRGGKDGWFKLKDIQYKTNEITASIAVNVINNPKLRIDRYSGAISISGKAGDYVGKCKKFDPANARREF